MTATEEVVVSKDELQASICRDSFFEFVKEFWDTVVPEDFVGNWHIEFLCDELQKVAERVFKGLSKEHDVIINIPPGTTKSTICSIMFPAWVWTRMPTARVICGSYAYQLSMDLSRKSRDVVQSDKYLGYFGDIELREDQNTKGYFLNNHGGFRFAVGVGGSVTGFHAHFIIIDDPLDPAEAASDAELKTANNWMSETLPTRKVDKKMTVTVLIMQRLHQDDCTGHTLKKKKDKIWHICLPGEVHDDNRKDVKPRRLLRKYKKGLLDPERLSRDVLEEMKVDLGKYGYAGQVLQTPIPRGGGMFEIQHLQIRDLPPRRKFKRLLRYWDKAGTQDGGAFTAGVLMGIDFEEPCRYWVLDVVKGQWSSGNREKIIKNTAIIDGEDVEIGVEQEPGSGGKESAEGTVSRLAGFTVHVDRFHSPFTIQTLP